MGGGEVLCEYVSAKVKRFQGWQPYRAGSNLYSICF